MQKTPVGETKDTKVNGMLHAELCWRARSIHRTAKVEKYCMRTTRGGAKSAKHHISVPLYQSCYILSSY